MERAIIKDGKQYFFYDDPEWEVDYKKSEVEGVLNIDDETGFHACLSSFDCIYGVLQQYMMCICTKKTLQMSHLQSCLTIWILMKVKLERKLSCLQ